MVSEKMTRIRLPKGSAFKGLLDWGEHSHAEMVRQARAFAAHQMEEANAVLNAQDRDFEVAIVRGPYVQHFVRVVDPGPIPTDIGDGASPF